MVEKLHLVLTCFVTQEKRDGSMSDSNRAEMLLESLNSLRRLPLSSADIYLEVGEELLEYTGAIEKLAVDLAPSVRLHNYRLENFADWKKAINSDGVQNSAVALLLTYEDHAFVDNSSDHIMDLANLLQEASSWSKKETIVSLSHFPEAQIQTDCWSAVGLRYRFKNFDLIPSVTPTGCLLVKPQTLMKWFSCDFTNGNRIVSTENYFGPSVTDGDCYSLVPKREQFRHLDGYQHVRLVRNPSNGRRESLLGLEGKARTFTAMTRLELISGPRQYLTFLGTIRLFDRVTLSFRSSVIWLAAWLTRGHLTSAHKVVMSRYPKLYFYLSSAYSHGIFRYASIVLVALYRLTGRGARP